MHGCAGAGQTEISAEVPQPFIHRHKSVIGLISLPKCEIYQMVKGCRSIELAEVMSSGSDVIVIGAAPAFHEELHDTACGVMTRQRDLSTGSRSIVM